MFPFVAAIFLIVPILEIYLLIQVGTLIGAGWTIGLVVLTAVIGVQLLKVQGFSTLSRAKQKVDSGEIPAQEMLEGMALVVAGALLLTPGFFTGAVGFFLLLPPTRRWLMKELAGRMVLSSTFIRSQGHQQSHKSDDVIDGVNYHRED